MGLFDKLEKRLEAGVNNAFAKAFRAEVQPVELASAVRRAMDDRATSVGKGKRPIVPNLFDVELSSTDYGQLTEYEAALVDELKASAAEHAETQRYTPGGPLTINFTENDELETGVFKVRPQIARQVAEAAYSEPAHPESAHDEAEYDHPEVDEEPVERSAPRRGFALPGRRRLSDDVDPNVYDAPTHDAEPDHQTADDESTWHGGSTQWEPADQHDPHHDDSPAAGDWRSTGRHSDASPQFDDDRGAAHAAGDQQFDQSRRRHAAADRHPNRGGEEGGHQPYWPEPEQPRAPQTLRPSPAAPRSYRQRPQLDIDGDLYPLLGAITVIGRDDDVDIVLDDGGVSRRHSEIRVTNDGPHLVASLSDLGSTNGTFLNGERVTSVRLNDGDRITVGRTSMIFCTGSRR
ncbi:DUF3662 and FHA domain-containing protein [Yimella sp. cx-51]|uniref:DUF3662 and FHA domain-containing protein n=1 Tax=Yimella sp. cx-51 TaxID=2770551 RepID=UPI001FCC7459|nr:DUF3662 and FHA domain-containing protein [Yimella sp. cx-51]